MSAYKFWGMVAALLILGAILALADLRLPNPEFYKTVGHALFVAGLLASTVDLYYKNILFKEGANDISKFLLGYELPKEVQDRIRSLMSTQLVRRDYKITVTFPDSLADAHMPVKVEQSFDFDNITESRIQHEHTHAFDQSDEATDLEIWADCPERSYRLKKDAVLRKPGLGKTVINWLIMNIPAHNYSRNLKYQCGLTFMMEQKDVRDGHNFNFHVPTINLTIDAKGTKELEAVVLAPEPDKSENNHWEYYRLFTPGESIRIQWSPSGSRQSTGGEERMPTDSVQPAK